MSELNMKDVVSKGLDGYLKYIHDRDKKIGTLSFTYFSLAQLGELKGILIATPDVLEKMNQQYALYSHVNNDSVNYCPIYQIPKKDLENRPKKDIPLAMYHHLIEQFGQKAVDLLIVDEDVMKNNIKNMIQFAMDTIYHDDGIIIEFETIKGLNAAQIMLGATSSVPDMIYEVAQEYFEIVTQAENVRTGKLSVLIKKKGENGDDKG